MSRGRKQSPFIGKRVHEVEDGVPILYARYSKVDDLLQGSATTASAEPSAKKAKRSKAVAESGAGEAGEAAADPPAKRSKKDKAAQLAAEAQRAGGTPNGAAAAANAAPAPATKQRKGKQAPAPTGTGKDDAPAAQDAAASTRPTAAAQHARPPVLSGAANTQEAEAMRQVLGFTATSSRAAQSFSFGFSVSQQVEAETEAKLQRIKMLDSADKDGYVPRRVFVGGMPYQYDEAALREYWGYCGEIESLDMMTFPDTGRFRGIAFVTYATQEGYEAALACDGEQLEGQTLKVDKCKAAAATKHRPRPGAAAAGQKSAVAPPPAGEPQKVPGYHVAYVGNIAFEATPEEVQAVFDGCSVTRVRLHTDRTTGRSKGYAHVHFKAEAGVDRAVGELNGAELHGRALRVSYAQPKPGAA